MITLLPGDATHEALVFEPGVPATIADRVEAVVVGNKNRTCAAGALVGMAWVAGGSKGRPKTKFTGNVEQYGRQVFEELVLRGVPPSAILAAHDELAALFLEGLPMQKQVEEIEGFSEAEAPSTS